MHFHRLTSWSLKVMWIFPENTLFSCSWCPWAALACLRCYLWVQFIRQSSDMLECFHTFAPWDWVSALTCLEGSSSSQRWLFSDTSIGPSVAHQMQSVSDSAHICSSAFHANAVKIRSVSPADEVESFCLKDAVSDWLTLECMIVGYSGEMCLIMQCSTVSSTPFRAFMCTSLHVFRC